MLLRNGTFRGFRRLGHRAPAIMNRRNHMYVSVRNTGPEAADDVSVTAYRSDPATDILWSYDVSDIGMLSVRGSIRAGQDVAVAPLLGDSLHRGTREPSSRCGQPR